MLDVSINQWWMDRAALVARSALCGLGLEADNLQFDEIEFQVGGLTELSGVAPIAETEFPPETPGSPKRFGMTWRSESEQEWQAGSDRINLSYHHWARVFDLYQFSVSTSPVVTVLGPSKPWHEWQLLYVDPIRELTSLSTAKHQDACWVLLGRRVVEPKLGKPAETVERMVRAQLFTAGLTQEPYLAERGDPTRAAFVTLGRPGASLATYVERWRANAEAQATFFELFVASMSPNLSDRARFLTVTPALESFHAIKADDSRTIATHKRLREEVLARVGPSVDSGDRKWLKANIERRGTPGLERRLRELYDQLPQDLRQEIGARIDPIPGNLASINPDASNVWQCLGRLRNDLAHGGPAHSASEIRAALRIGTTLMLALALQAIGAPTGELAAYIESDLWPAV